MKRALLVVPLFLALVVVLPAAPAHACSCAMLSSAQKVENADVVVRGTITGLDDPGGLDSGHLVTWEVAVAEVYQGAAAGTAFVRSASDGASCGIEVQEGREYLLFARQVGGDLRAGLCGGTTPASAALDRRGRAPHRPREPATGRGRGHGHDAPWHTEQRHAPCGPHDPGQLRRRPSPGCRRRRCPGRGGAGRALVAATPGQRGRARRLRPTARCAARSPERAAHRGISAGSWPAPAPGRRHPRPPPAPRACWPAGWWR